MTGVCSTTNAHLSSPTLSSAEVDVLGSQSMVLPKTPTADEVLADSFLSIDEGQDADFLLPTTVTRSARVRILRQSLQPQNLLLLKMRPWPQLSRHTRM